MNLLQDLTGLAEWGELAAILTIALAAFHLLKYGFTSLYYFGKVKALRQAKLTISILIKSEPKDRVVLSYATYHRKPLRWSLAFGNWQKNKQVSIRGSLGVYVVNKNDILANCQNHNDAYHFMLDVPNSTQTKAKYYARIAAAGYIITGRGHVNYSDDGRWTIFFVHCDEPYHPRSGQTWTLKNSLGEWAK